MATQSAIRQTTKEHSLYKWAAVLVAVIVLAGFARSYYLKGIFGGAALPGLLVHLHGIVMTLWVVLFITQVWLISSSHTRLHKRLGIFGAILAASLVVVGAATAIAAGARNASQGAPALQFLAVPLFDMLVFAILVGTSLYFRRRFDIHKRLMLLATISLLSAAVARIPFNFIANGGPIVFFGLIDLFIVACIVFDTIKHRRLHPAFLWGALLIVASQPLRLMLAGTDVWIRFASWLIK